MPQVPSSDIDIFENFFFVEKVTKKLSHISGNANSKSGKSHKKIRVDSDPWLRVIHD